LGTDPWMLALDSNAFTYWIQTMNGAPDQPSEPFADEKLALVRIFFWMPSNASFKIVRTVRAEYEVIRDGGKLDSHNAWALTHVSEVRPIPDDAVAGTRAQELSSFHSGENDRKIIAECELSSIAGLLTCDTKLLEGLRMETHVWIARPTAFWEWMRIPKGQPANRAPAGGNPLLECSWWRW
jgi:hypothetical protein